MPPRKTTQSEDLDGLRLVALSRIPRCSGCPRFHALVAAHDGGSARESLPEAPPYCTHRVCAPLAARWSSPEAGERPRRVRDSVYFPYAS